MTYRGTLPAALQADFAPVEGNEVSPGDTFWQKRCPGTRPIVSNNDKECSSRKVYWFYEEIFINLSEGKKIVFTLALFAVMGYPINQ